MKRTLKNSWTETSLIRACLQNDRRAQEVFYKKYYGMLMSICLRYAADRDEAAFILNQAFFKIFKGLQRFSSTKGSIKTWMYRITINTAIDHYRKEISKTKNTIEINEEEDHYLMLEDPLSSLTAEELLSLIQQLSPSYKLVFNMFVIEGYNHKEIGERLKIAEGTSKSNLAKARKKMQELWLEMNKKVKYGNQ